MRSKPASAETLKSLYENAGKNFELLLPTLDGSVSRLEDIQAIDESSLSPRLLEIKEFWQRLLKIYIYSLIVNLDIIAAFRANLRSKSNIEKRINLKYINVLTVEGYKYLFHNKKDKDDHFNSVWSKFMDAAKALQVDELISDFSEVEAAAQQFAHNYVRNIDIKNRNLAIHYDNNPLKVCKYIESIDNEDIECKRINGFLAITELIHKYILKWSKILTMPMVLDASLICKNNEKKDLFTTEQAEEIYDKADNVMQGYTKTINDLYTKYIKFESFATKISKERNCQVDFADEMSVIYPGLQVSLIYIDLACATRAVIKSDYNFEKMLNLRRFNVVIYEGFKKIYGYSEFQQKRSFWDTHISSILDSSEDALTIKNLNEIGSRLKKLSTNPIVFDEKLRNCSVHYRYKDCDYTLDMYRKVKDLNIAIECFKTIEIMRLLPALLDISNNAMQKKSDDASKKSKKQQDDMIAKFDALFDKVTSNPNADSKTVEFCNEMRVKVRDLYKIYDNLKIVLVR